MSCLRCGHKREGQVQPHNLGCPNRLAAKPAGPRKEPAVTGPLCAKDGCENPRLVSRGPRPAKFCEEHKTTRSK